MFRLLYEFQNIKKERTMHVKDQLFIRGYAGKSVSAGYS